MARFTRCTAFLCLSVMFLTNLLAPISLAQTSDRLQAIKDARAHAKWDYNEGSGFCIGVGFGLIGTGLGYLYPNRVPPHRSVFLEGKSEEYVSAYYKFYTHEIRRLRTNESLLGVASFVIFLGVFSFIYSSSSD